MSDDLTAARERHHPGATINRIGPDFGKQQCDYCCRKWPCDAARFRDALDAMTDRAARISAEADRFLRERDAARALADELGHELKRWHDEAHRTSCPFICPTLAALAKWEASK